MKLRFKYFFLLLFLLSKLYSQEFKRNNLWTLGFAPVVVYNFGGTSLSIDSLSYPALIDASTISDTNGNLLFFSTGFGLYNSSGIVMENSLDINSPYGNNLANFYSHFGRSAQTSIILPKKGNQYYVISTGMSDSVANILINNIIYLGYDVLNYSVVDMDSNMGKGKVIEKNKVILDNQRYANCAMTAVKHGNGKDWWLVKADCYKHQYQTFLVKADTILGPYFYNIPDTTNDCVYYSEIYFSDDGTKFASSIYQDVDTNQFYLYNRVDLFDFDRCNGQFTYRNYYNIPADMTSFAFQDGVTGISFSPNSKLLYMSNLYSIYQIDIIDTNRYNGIFIHGPDDSLSVFPSYYISKCGPNGKLYIGNFDGTRNSMSYIDSPNIRGVGCNFVPKGLTQSFNNNLLHPPNMPNYGLGKAPVGGNCWPEAVNNLELENDLMVYPNPANDFLFVESEWLINRVNTITLFDMLGRMVKTQQLFSVSNKLHLDIHELHTGVYFIKVGNAVRKVVKE